MDGKLVPSLSWEVLDLRTTPTSQSDGHLLFTTGLHAAFNLGCLVVTHSIAPLWHLLPKCHPLTLVANRVCS